MARTARGDPCWHRGDGNGGGIFSIFGPLTVSNSVFSGNCATGNGGGIYNDVGMLIVNGGVFADNSATDGGGIYNTGTLIHTGNLFFDNTGGDIYPSGF